MDDALGMDNDLDAVHADVEEPACLDHFEAFVEEGGGIDGDLAAHDPGRVFEGLFEGDLGEGFDGPGGPVTERPATGGEPKIADGAGGLVLEALEDGGMFAVDGEDADPVAAGFVHDDAPGHDEDFLGGDGDVLAGADGGEGGGEAGGADDGDEDDVGFGEDGEFEETGVTGGDGDAGETGGEGRGLGRILDGDAERMMSEGLFGEEIGIGAGGEADEPQFGGQVLDDLEGAGADGAGAAEQDDVLHAECRLGWISRGGRRDGRSWRGVAGRWPGFFRDGTGWRTRCRARRLRRRGCRNRSG